MEGPVHGILGRTPSLLAMPKWGWVCEDRRP